MDIADSCHSAPEPRGVLRGSDFRSADEVLDRGARAASVLSAVGVGAGSRVGFLLRNDHAVIEVALACDLLGAAAIPINWHGTGDEVQKLLAIAEARALVAHEDLLVPIRGQLPAGTELLTVQTPPDIAARYNLDSAPAALGTYWDDAVAEACPWRDARSSSQAPMFFTSGSTGVPKGVLRSGAGIAHDDAARLVADAEALLGITAGMRTAIAGPMYHVAPYTYSMAAFKKGAFVVLQTRFDPEELLALIDRHRLTHLSLVPTMFVRLLRLPDDVKRRYDVSSLTHVVHGAAPCAPDVKRQMIEWWGPIVWEYYGTTETGALVGCSSSEWLSRPGTVGRPLPSATVSIFDERGEPAPTGTVGEIFMWANGLTDFEYLKNANEPSPPRRSGLITCGDVGYVDADGYLFLCDRYRDVIISGGVNIYPAEIEACLLTLPMVQDCAVFGIPDQEFGESVAAAIELVPGSQMTESAVRAHLRGSLAGYKVPKVITFHDLLAREDSGKIRKNALREPYWAGTGRRI